ncbi:MAG: hypothetical protein M1813_003418 [Trichoglossum hirsutum]|nr:MAG: hypothetical protein M1813_003418 [Trichoglossum hirsutum]
MQSQRSAEQDSRPPAEPAKSESRRSHSSIKTIIASAASAKDPDTHMGDPNTHEKDSGTRGRKGIPQKLTFRHNTSKSSKMKDIDQERLRTQLIEEAKQRKFLGQAASNREARITQTGGVHWISRD